MNEKLREQGNLQNAAIPSLVLGRRSFVKGIAAVGAGVAVSPLLSEAAQNQAPAVPATPPATGNARNSSLWGPFTPSNQLGKYFQFEYPASSAAGELQLSVTYTFWMPDNISKVRGVIVHQHGASIPAAQAGATSAYDLQWQALAKKWDCVLLGPSYRVLNDAIDLTPGGAELWFDPRKGSDATFLRALDEVAAKSGHPEIAGAPWCLWGHSGGGIWANVISMLHPTRVAAAFLRSGTAAMFRPKPEFIQPDVPEAVYRIPTMTNAGVLEKKNLPWTGSIATFQEYRAQGAPIGFAPDPRTGHFTGDSRYFAIPFFDACLAMRLPDNGAQDQTLKPVDLSQAWLAPFLGDTAVPLADFKGNPKEAVWLPNADVAKAWMEYVRHGTVSDITMPPAPFNVRVAAKGDQGNVITWDAEAAGPSGIGGFVVQRNGHGIARLPERAPDQVFGRPLFQGLSFHDTPETPFPGMAYVDTSAKSGTSYKYTVIALSSAGVPSVPSDPGSNS
jgi:hypothetical protein